ncbi:TetR/AcrR family transcriptional regulator [Chitinophaga sp. CB10]|uniref:TetR/AcrR family transcriptional regulator n=1 Tax=Chitinophaga sp. CB10 TaxID=1891659 RepID=UPI0025B8C4A3|nr:TetR/AcrR family transcriptional regulator [Chitinophaga sp. CB10]
MMTKGEKTRQFIIEQSAILLNKQGMAGTAISDIMEVTKMAKGGIYGNFANKEEICREVFDYLMAQLATRIEARLAQEDTWKDKLVALVDFYYDLVLANNNGGCPMLNFGTEADDTDLAMKAKVAAGIKRTQARIEKLVANGIKAGEFTQKARPAEFALKMFTMIEGGILVARVTDNASQMKAVCGILKQEIESFSTRGA